MLYLIIYHNYECNSSSFTFFVFIRDVSYIRILNNPDIRISETGDRNTFFQDIRIVKMIQIHQMLLIIPLF